jgi:predicted small secreted protein
VDHSNIALLHRVEPVHLFGVDDRYIIIRETPSMKLSRVAPLAVIAVALVLSGCANTVRGVGKDVKGTARAVEQTVKN